MKMFEYPERISISPTFRQKREDDFYLVDRKAFPGKGTEYVRADRIEELEAKLARYNDLVADKIDLQSENIALKAKLAKAVADMKAITDVSTLMQSSASHDRFKHNTVVTDSIWSQWSKQLKFTRTTLAELTGGKDE